MLVGILRHGFDEAVDCCAGLPPNIEAFTYMRLTWHLD